MLETSTATQPSIQEGKLGLPLLGAEPDPSLPTSPHFGVEFLWTNAREQFLDQLSTRERQKEEAHVDRATLKDTVAISSVSKAKAEKAYGPKFKGKLVEIKLSRIMQRLEIILRLGDVATKFATESASYVWAAFRLVASGIT